jgi:hypothetical protein
MPRARAAPLSCRTRAPGTQYETEGRITLAEDGTTTGMLTDGPVSGGWGVDAATAEGKLVFMMLCRPVSLHASMAGAT